MSLDFDCYLEEKPLFAIQNIVGESWQIAIYGPMAFEAEDIRPEVLSLIDGRKWLLNIHLEGVPTDTAYRQLENLFNTLIKERGGCVHDLQTETFFDRSGETVVKDAPQPKIKPAAPLHLSFYFEQAPDVGHAEKAAIYDIIERCAPKALPRRYGTYEPYPFSLEKDGKPHFLDLWAKTDDIMDDIYWRAAAPYQRASAMFCKGPGDGRGPTGRRYRCAEIEIEVSAKTLKTKKALKDLLTLQAELSAHLGVFYSELSAAQGDRSRWWRGIPAEPAYAVCLGKPYADLWPEFIDGAKPIGDDLYFRDKLISGHEV